MNNYINNNKIIIKYLFKNKKFDNNKTLIYHESISICKLY